MVHKAVSKATYHRLPWSTVDSIQLIIWSAIFLCDGGNDLFFWHRFQTGSGAHPAFYPMGIGDSFPGGKVAGAWSWSFTSF